MKKTRLTFAVLLSVLFTFGAAQAVFADSVNCSDFDTQPEAQAHLEADPSDPDGLDRDKDGVACEHLPGGDSSSSSNNNVVEENTNESEVTSGDASSTDEPASSGNESTTEDTTSSEENATSSDDSTTPEESASTNQEEGGELPSTATTLPLGIVGGLGAMALGALGFRKRK